MASSALLASVGGPAPTLPLFPRVAFNPVARAAATSGGAFPLIQHTPSLWEQVADAVKNAPAGLLNFGGQALQQSINTPEFLQNVGGNLLRGESPDLGENIRTLMPVTESFRQQGQETLQDVRHPTEYVRAYHEGTLVPKLLNDVATASILAGPVAKALTAAAGPEAAAAEAATQASRVGAAETAAEGATAAPAAAAAPVATVTAPVRAPLLSAWRASPGALTAEQVARPGLLRAAQAVEAARYPLEQTAFSPAKVWTAPIKAVTGFDLPFFRRKVEVPGELPEAATVGNTKTGGLVHFASPEGWRGIAQGGFRGGESGVLGPGVYVGRYGTPGMEGMAGSWADLDMERVPRPVQLAPGMKVLDLGQDAFYNRNGTFRVTEQALRDNGIDPAVYEQYRGQSRFGGDREAVAQAARHAGYDAVTDDYQTNVFDPAKVWSGTPPAVQRVPVRVGVRPLLQKVGVEDAVRNLPSVQGIEDRVHAWRANQDLLKTTRDVAIYPWTSEFGNRLWRAGKLIASGARILGGDPELEHAANLIRSVGPLGEVPGQFRAAVEHAAGDVLTPEQIDSYVRDFTGRVHGETQAPTGRTSQIVADYMNGTLDPKVADQIRAANERARIPGAELEQQKLETGVDQQGRLESGLSKRAMSQEQVGNAPMESKIAPRLAPFDQRIEELHRSTYGYVDPVTGEPIPGLEQKVAQARAAVPTPNMADIAASRALAASERAGALTGEGEAAGRFAARADQQAWTQADRAAQARLNTVEGAREAFAGLTRERYGIADYHPELAESTVRIGEAERQGGEVAGGRVGYAVPEDEYQAARRVLRMERPNVAPIVRTAGVAERAGQTAQQADRAGVEAQGRTFTAAAEPIVTRAGEWQPPVPDEPPAAGTPFSKQERTDVRGLVADVRRRAQQEADYQEERIWSALGGHIASPLADIRAWAEHTLNPDEEALFRRYMDRGGGKKVTDLTGTTVDQWEQILNSERGAGAQAVEGTGQAVEEVLRRMKAARAARDFAAGKPSSFADSLEMDLSPVERRVMDAPGPERAAAYREAVREDIENLRPRVLPHTTDGPRPWTLTVDQYKAELVDVQDALERGGDEAQQALRRVEELVPDSVVDLGGRELTPEEYHARVRALADRMGEDVPPGPGVLEAAGAAGGAAQAESADIAREAYNFDRQQLADNPDLPPEHLASKWLEPNERVLYDAMQARDRALATGDKAQTAATRVAVGERQAGERAGVDVGRAEGAQRVYEQEGARAGRRAETVGGKVEEAQQRAQQTAEQEAGKALRFGERRGKLIRDRQVLERELGSAKRKLDWLSDKRGEREALLRQGPKETAPGRYFPLLSGMERARAAGNDIADSIDKIAPGAGDVIRGDMPQILDTMQKLQAKYPDYDPEYLPGVPARAPGRQRTAGGTKEQLGYEGKLTGQRQKRYGTTPRTFQDLLRGYANDVRAITRNKSAWALSDALGRTAGDVIRELHQQGKLVDSNGLPMTDQLVESILSGAQGPEALDALLTRSEYTAWNPNTPQTTVPTRQVKADTVVLPKTVVDHFERWWAPASPNPIVRGYDFLTRGFKHNVLAMSPRWHVWNVLGNSFMATFGAGLSPVQVVRGIVEAKRLMKEEFRTGEPQLPARLKSAGPGAEAMSGMVEGRVPRTVFGRLINKSYEVNSYVDDLMHSAVYLAKKAKGYSDETAVELSLRAMGDFSRMTPFERNVVRRVIPFYAWARHVTQATFRLAAEHPYRTAWLLHLSQMFGPDDQILPSWLQGATRLPGANWFLNVGTANPYEGSVGSAFNSPADWPSQIGRSLNPLIKLGAAATTGMDVGSMEALTRPPGTGNLDVYGNPLPTPLLTDPAAFGQFASRLIPAGKLFHDIADTRLFTRPSYSLYDTGDVQKFHGQAKEQPGGLPAQLFRFGSDLGIPFMPSYYDEQQGNVRVLKGQRTAELARRRYFGS